jgi:two-component system, sensor histidine kinase
MARAKAGKRSTAKPARRRPRPSARPSPQSSPPSSPPGRDADPAAEASLVAYAHDIRTALTGILALGELLVSSSLGDRERRWASGIKASAEHLSALTTLMIDAAKADVGTLTLRKEAFSLRRLIEALTDSLSARAETKGLAAEVTLADDVPDQLVGDAVRLRAALENLVDNAVKFTERGAVRLGVRCTPAARGRVKLVFAVSDSGIGLKPAEIHRLFRPFQQANAEIARRYGGTGLGLAVVKTLAKLMGGDLTVTSAHGRGSVFTLAIVLAPAPVEAADHAPRKQMDVAPRRHTVLCVEDNPYGRVILNTILTELGHRADFAASGEEAVTAVTRGYDAVLMDVTLPGIDGLEATRRIRALPGTAGRTPIVGISGRAEAGDEAAARAAGMDSYVRKPVSPSALSEALAAVSPQ